MRAMAGWRRRTAALAVLVLAGGLGPECDPPAALEIVRPLEGQLSLAGDVAVALALAPGADAGALRLELDGVDVTAALGGAGEGTLPGVAAGEHELVASLGASEVVRRFETVDLARPDFDPDQCEILNAAECLLPYPSSRFLEPADDTPNRKRLAIPQLGIPRQNGNELPAAMFRVRDGFSPGSQILMNFPAGVDLVASGAARLLAATRSTDETSLSAASPSVLVEWDTRTRILHWLENDARVANPARRVLFLRPGRALTPGRTYLVALRHLVDEAGHAVEAEPVFAALRDGRPTDIPAVEARREAMEELFARLAEMGVARESLVLAFDFQVASDENLTGQMLSMRDQGFAWLAAQDQQASPTFTVDEVLTSDCAQPGQKVWKEVRGTFQVPLFLTSDPETDPLTPGVLRVGADGVTPVAQGVTNPPYGISIPCEALESPATTRVYPLILGHGLFGSGPDFALGSRPSPSNPNPAGVTESIAAADDRFDIGLEGGFPYIGGATNWRGLSAPDASPNLLGTPSFIVTSIAFDLRNFPALPDRLRQGVLNQLVLMRMMKSGAFNAHPEFRAPAGHGVFRPGEDGFYFGISLGGVMGLKFIALSPDLVHANTDVPSINFLCLLQRATPFLEFQIVLDLTIEFDATTGPNPTRQILGLSLVNELWATGESVGYASHITENPLPGTNRKQVLLTMAWLDEQVSNQCTEITARTLELPMLRGSLLSGLPQIRDREGPLESAMVVYDTASFDLSDPAQQSIIPPLANRPSRRNRCDPHGRRQFIPASLRQLVAFLQPGGRVVNFCDGICDADAALTEVGPLGDLFSTEMPQGDPARCVPFPP